MFTELDTVVLSHDIKEHNLTGGDVGAVVHVYENNKAYEVEFVTGEGKTIAVITLTRDDIRPMERQEILHVRSYAMA
jgi:putative heme iron utilization protein